MTRKQSTVRRRERGGRMTIYMHPRDHGGPGRLIAQNVHGQSGFRILGQHGEKILDVPRTLHHGGVDGAHHPPDEYAPGFVGRTLPQRLPSLRKLIDDDDGWIDDGTNRGHGGDGHERGARHEDGRGCIEERIVHDRRQGAIRGRDAHGHPASGQGRTDPQTFKDRGDDERGRARQDHVMMSRDRDGHHGDVARGNVFGEFRHIQDCMIGSDGRKERGDAEIRSNSNHTNSIGLVTVGAIPVQGGEVGFQGVEQFLLTARIFQIVSKVDIEGVDRYESPMTIVDADVDIWHATLGVR